MRELPSGTVTFLFTDIEGSTKLLHELGDAYAEALAEHRRGLRAAFEAHGGVEVDTQGDAFFVAFARARDALAAAREGQQALADGPIRVRMGLHTGEPIVTEEGYVGIDVHRAARIAAVGHGGQVLVSQSTRELAGADGLHDLGKHRLKDFDDPVALFQLGELAFPPLKTISNTNLPRPASSFVGRARETAEIVAQLQNGARLLTLTGPGGSGKTRLAIEAAAELVPEFKAGVFWIALSPVRDPELVSPAIAQTVGLSASLAESIGDRELLLLLDNLEQVVEAGPELASLVELCPNLRLLMTSREALRVRGEVEYPVESLADPDAVELFRTRARTDSDEAVAELCHALDNLPLALELAAARTTVLAPRQILERLSDRLDLLRGGRDADPRQQTLRATIEWSYELLSPEERRLFARLAVFSRGSTLEAAEQVAGADLDTLQSLVEKNLVRHTEERFWLLESIRELAAERLRDSGELPDLAGRHAAYFRAFAEEAEGELLGPGSSDALDRVDGDLDNVRQAFRWGVEQGGCEQALATVVSLERFWSNRGLPRDLLGMLEAALQGRCASVTGELRARAAWLAGFQWVRAEEPRRAEGLYREALELFLELGQRYRAVRCLGELAIVAQEHGREAEAAEQAERALAIARDLGDPRALAVATTGLATVAYFQRDFTAAAGLYEESLRFNREAENAPGPIASCLYNIGLSARELGDYDRAEAALREALELATGARHGVLIGNSANTLGYVLLARGDVEGARSLFLHGIEALKELDNPVWICSALNLMALISAERGDDRDAALLWGAVDALLEHAGRTQLPEDLEVQARAQEEPRVWASLGQVERAAATGEGRGLAREQAIELAIALAER